MKKYTDIEIITLLKSNNKTSEKRALDHLYPEHYKKIRSFITNNSGTEDDAIHVFHDGLIAFLNKCRQEDFILKATIGTLLYSICKHKWLNELRKHKNVKETELKESLLWKFKSGNIQKQLELNHGKQLIHEILKEIGYVSSKCFKIIDSFYFENKRLKEVMVDLKLPSMGATKTQKDRCMKKLKAEIKSNSDFTSYLKEFLKDLARDIG